MEELREVVSLLKSMEKEKDHAADRNGMLATALFTLGEYKAAASYCKKVPKGESTAVKHLLEDCTQILTRPKDKESFRSRVQKAWEAFTPVEADLRKRINSAQYNPKAQNKLVQQINSLLCIAFRETGWTWNPGERPMIELDPDLMRCVALAQQYFIDHAPKEVSERWNLHVGDWSPSEEELADMNRTPGWLCDMDVQIEPLPTGLLKLVVYHPLLDPNVASEENKAKVLDKIKNNLGELMFISAFYTADFRGMPPKGRTLKLGQLLPTLEAMGFGNREDPHSILQRRHSFHIIPRDRKAYPGYCWRDDVFRGTTMEPTLSLFYGRNNWIPVGAGHLAGSGAVPCFVVFPLKDQTDNPPALMESLLAELDSTMDPEIALA